MWLANGVEEPFGWRVVKVPPIRIWPFERRTTTSTSPLASGSKVGSRVPSEVTRPR